MSISGSVPAPITASMLYDLVTCPHRVTMDLYGDQQKKDDVNPFVKLLWEKGTLYEGEVIQGLKLSFIDLRQYSDDDKAAATRKAMADGVPLIYSGRIEADGLLGVPDLLRKEGSGYAPIDIKSGSGKEGGDEDDDGKPKKHYAVQLALYVDILERLGLSAGRVAYIWDVHGKEVAYKLEEPRAKTSKESLWQEYQACLTKAQNIVNGSFETLPAYASACKLCHWYSVCYEAVKASNDLSLISELGRARRDAMIDEIPTVTALAEINPEAYHKGKTTVFDGIGHKSLYKFHKRARLLAGHDLGPYLKEVVSLPASALEIFFDIEVDPMRDYCYLHGFVERQNQDNSTEKYVSMFMDEVTKEAEEQAFFQAWRYIQEKQPCAIYYYSPYEKTRWKKLQALYPNVCKAEEVEALFESANVIDLYTDIVRKHTEWPTHDQSIKTLAKHLGFAWRDTHPSGAASIQWFDEWVKLRDPSMKQRILDYNEDDCLATRCLLDGIRNLSQPADEMSEQKTG